MRFRFTKHAEQKFQLLKKYNFTVSRNKIKQTIKFPIKKEGRPDGTFIASSMLDKTHILRIVYKYKDDIIIVITFYPGRRKAYEI